MPSALLDIYCDASLARWRATSPGERPEIDRPGLHGLGASSEHPSVVMLVRDDRSLGTLETLLDEATSGLIHVFETAPRALERLHQADGWTASEDTAMVCADLAVVPRLALPAALTLHGVRRDDPEDPEDGVALEDVAACVVRADPGEDCAHLTRYLRSLTSTRLFAALDAGGQVQATAGYGLTGQHARVILVDTDQAWRRQGVGAAMTALVLQDAVRRGAREASLDATELGQSVYARVGFASLGPIVRFRR